MYKTLAFVPFLLLGSVQAKPKQPCLKCTPDSCALVALQTGLAAEDPMDLCSAFMRTTVTPLTSYATVTATASQTVDVTEVLTKSIFDTATQTDTTSAITLETSFATVTDVATKTNSVDVTITNTETLTTTATQTSTCFVTTTLGVVNPPKAIKKGSCVDNPSLRRAIAAGRRNFPDMPLPVDVNVSASVSAAGASVPAFAADACLDVDAYSSACRCAGVRPTTIMAPAPSAALTMIEGAQITETTQVDSTASLTTTATQTQTIVVTEMVSLTITVSATSTVDQSVMCIVAIHAGFVSTDTITALATTTTAVLETTATVVTSTVTPVPSDGVLRVQGSRFDGKYAIIDFPNDDDASHHQVVRSFVPPKFQATRVSITEAGELSVLGYNAASPNSRVTPLFFEPASDIQFNNLLALVCAVAPVSGLVTCTRNPGGSPSPVVFQQCEAQVNDETTGAGVVISDQEEDGCSKSEFVLEPQEVSPN
ncbi:hypothetical protein PG993_010178 [Apiospora rasikravindrae]|uniref:IPT/TIG domain-containing protein n=1 Tax=Apiospora rasikravindrae TaxID=990691 RepID=A0ABR1SLJ0_9PEZI